MIESYLFVTPLSRNILVTFKTFSLVDLCLLSYFPSWEACHHEPLVSLCLPLQFSLGEARHHESSSGPLSSFTIPIVRDSPVQVFLHSSLHETLTHQEYSHGSRSSLVLLFHEGFSLLTDLLDLALWEPSLRPLISLLKVEITNIFILTDIQRLDRPKIQIYIKLENFDIPISLSWYLNNDRCWANLNLNTIKSETDLVLYIDIQCGFKKSAHGQCLVLVQGHAQTPMKKHGRDRTIGSHPKSHRTVIWLSNFLLFFYIYLIIC